MAAQTAHAGGTLPLGSGFSTPQGVAVDRSGNVYVADSSNNAVKEIMAVGGVIPASPTINTLGSGFSFPTGVAVDGSGNVYVADDGNSAVKEIMAVGGVIPASPTINTLGSGFNFPTGVAVDGSGNVYVADTNHNAVKEIMAVGGVIPASPTINTLGSGFSNPSGVAVDGSGNVYVADFSNNAVKEIMEVGGVIPASPTINTLGSGFNNPQGVAVDGSGNVYVAESSNNAVKEIMAVGGVIPASPTINTLGSGFNHPSGVAVDGSGNVYVGDRGNNAVKEIVTAPQKLPTTAVASTSASLSIPFTFDTGGSIGAPVVLTQGAAGLDFADAGTGSCTSNGTSHIYNAADTCTVDVTFTPKYPGQRLGAVQLTTTGGATIATAHIYGTGTGPLVTFPSNTTVNTLASGFNPFGVAVDGSGNVYVTDNGNNAVKEIMAVGGVIPTSPTINTLASGFNFPTGVAVDGSGNVYVADLNNNAVKEIMAVGGVIPASPTINTLGSGFNFPYAVAVDGNGNVYVADTLNGAVKEIMAVGGVIPTSPTIHTLGSGISSPEGVAVDGNGNVYVADTANNAVKEIMAVGGVIPASPTINTLGSGFNHPFGVAVDGSGNVYVGDSNNNAVKEIDLSDPPALVFATATPAGTTDTTDGPHTVTVANSGNAALTFTLPTSGNNPSISADFTLDSSGGTACPLIGSTSSSPGTLAAGASCSLPISFAPTVGGAIAGSLVLTDTNLNANPSTTQTISLNGTGQLPVPTLAFATIPDHTFGDTPFIITATSASTGAVTYSVTSGPATITGSTLTLTGVGTVVLSASQAATTSYAAATATTSFTVNAPVPTVAFATIPNHTFGDTPFTVTATSASTGAVTYSVTSGPATIAGNTVTLTGTGTVTLSASQAATASYAAATATTSFTVGAATPPLAFATIPNHTFGDTPFIVTATSASSGAVTYSVTSGPATIAGNTVTLTGVGTVVLSASQAATTSYAAATATTSFTVAAAPVLDFSMSTTTTQTQSVYRGSAATFIFSLAPTSGAYPGVVTFAATGLPGGAMATFSPSSLATNSGAQTVTLTVQTLDVAGLSQPISPRGGLIAFALLFLPLAGTRRMRRIALKLGGRTSLALLLLLSLGAVAGLSGCGDNLHSSAQNYTITMTATSGSVQHSSNVTLQVVQMQ
ncbi:MAG: NHL repeat-containing protein [Edaphobacter sp.]